MFQLDILNAVDWEMWFHAPGMPPVQAESVVFIIIIFVFYLIRPLSHFCILSQTMMLLSVKCSQA